MADAFPRRKAWAWKTEEDGKWHLSVLGNRRRPWNTYDTKDELGREAAKRQLEIIWETTG